MWTTYPQATSELRTPTVSRRDATAGKGITRRRIRFDPRPHNHLRDDVFLTSCWHGRCGGVNKLAQNASWDHTC